MDDEIAPVGGSPYPGKGADDRPKGHRRHRAGGGAADKVQPGGGGGGVVPLHRLGVGAGHQVAVDRGGHQHALAQRAGALEDDPAHPVPLALVQQVVLAPGGTEHKVTGRGHLVDGLSPQTGGVEDEPALHVTLGGMHPPALLHPFQAGDSVLQLQVGAVDHRCLRQGQTVLPGGADGGGGGVEHGAHLGGQVGFQAAGRFAGENLQPGHAVGLAPSEQDLQSLLIPLGEGGHKGAAPAVGHIQRPAQLSRQIRAPHVEPGHQGARLRVIPGVENGGVGLGGAAGHVVGPLQHADAQLITGQMEGRRCAGDAAADDNDVVQRNPS